MEALDGKVLSAQEKAKLKGHQKEQGRNSIGTKVDQGRFGVGQHPIELS
jgi:hypothetical protein